MNNNCHDNKIKKILEEGKKCNCTPIIVGPTGPTGPVGAATITVGTTTTTDPGTDATVTNSGTNENVILNFTIPRGEDGTTGPTGATARCNKSSIYIFLNGKVPYYFNIP